VRHETRVKDWVCFNRKDRKGQRARRYTANEVNEALAFQKFERHPLFTPEE